MFKVKSCGKAHPFCRECQPGVGANISVTLKDNPKCVEAGRKGGSAPHPGPGPNKGKTFSDEVKAAMGAAHSENIFCGIGQAEWQKAKGMNRHEQFVHDVLLADFPEVIFQQPFGSYVVDFYLPYPYHLAVEVDGWGHNPKTKQEFDEQRDVWLFQEVSLPVVRITHAEIEELMRSTSFQQTVTGT